MLLTPAMHTESPLPMTRTPKVLAFGDSITAGFVASVVGPLTIVRPNLAYPSLLEDALAERYLGQQVSVYNAGVDGETAANGQERFLKVFLNVDPDVVVLLEGFNDITLALFLADGENVSTSGIVDDLRRMARAAQVRGADVIIATLTPITNARERETPGKRAAIEDLNRRIRSLAGSIGIGSAVNLYAEMSSVDISHDGVHPTPAGYAHMAEIFQREITARFER